MDYKRIYDSLIDRAKNRHTSGYYEKHHIIPRCIGGDDSEYNLVKLMPEEHYIAHQLLMKIYPNNYSLVKAAVMMIPNRPSNKLYGWIKRKFSKAQSEGQSGINNSQYGTKWFYNSITGESKKSKVCPGEEWINGRTQKINECKYCNLQYKQIKFEKYCSEKCKIYDKSPAIKIIDDNIDDMIELFKINGSITKTLTNFGIEGRAGNFYFSKILKSKNLKVLTRRNTAGVA